MSCVGSLALAFCPFTAPSGTPSAMASTLLARYDAIEARLAALEAAPVGALALRWHSIAQRIERIAAQAVPVAAGVTVEEVRIAIACQHAAERPSSWRALLPFHTIRARTLSPAEPDAPRQAAEAPVVLCAAGSDHCRGARSP